MAAYSQLRIEHGDSPYLCKSIPEGSLPISSYDQFSSHLISSFLANIPMLSPVLAARLPFLSPPVEATSGRSLAAVAAATAAAVPSPSARERQVSGSAPG